MFINIPSLLYDQLLKYGTHIHIYANFTLACMNTEEIVSLHHKTSEALKHNAFHGIYSGIL